MVLLEIYTMYQEGKLSLEEFAKALGVTEKSLKFRLTRWGHRLPLLLSILDKLRIDAIDSREASETLGISMRQVTNLKETWKVESPIKPYLFQRESSKVKWDVHKKFAVDYIAGRISLVDAAESTGLSDRQLRRWVSKLLETHEQITFKDHSKLSLNEQSRMARRIEEAENLDVQKQMLAKAVSDGKKTIKDEAIDRVVFMKNRKRKPHV